MQDEEKKEPEDIPVLQLQLYTNPDEAKEESIKEKSP